MPIIPTPQLRPEDLSNLVLVSAAEPGVSLIGYDQDNPPQLVRVLTSSLSTDVSGKLDIDGDGSELTNLNASSITTGTIDPARLPALSLTATQTVADQAARLALTSEQAEGKIVVDADTGKSWSLVESGDPSDAGDWLQIGDRDIAIIDVSGLGTALSDLDEADVATLAASRPKIASLSEPLLIAELTTGLGTNGTVLDWLYAPPESPAEGDSYGIKVYPTPRVVAVVAASPTGGNVFQTALRNGKLLYGSGGSSPTFIAIHDATTGALMMRFDLIAPSSGGGEYAYGVAWISDTQFLAQIYEYGSSGHIIGDELRSYDISTGAIVQIGSVLFDSFNWNSYFLEVDLARKLCYVSSTDDNVLPVLKAIDFTDPADLTEVSAVGVKEVTQVVCVADVGDSLDGKSFVLHDKSGSVCVWLKTLVGTDPGGSDRSIEVDVATLATVSDVASAISAALIADGAWEASAVDEVVTITDAYKGARTDAADTDTGFAVTTTVQGSYSGFAGSEGGFFWNLILQPNGKLLAHDFITLFEIDVTDVAAMVNARAPYVFADNTTSFFEDMVLDSLDATKLVVTGRDTDNVAQVFKLALDGEDFVETGRFEGGNAGDGLAVRGDIAFLCNDNGGNAIDVYRLSDGTRLNSVKTANHANNLLLADSKLYAVGLIDSKLLILDAPVMEDYDFGVWKDANIDAHSIATWTSGDWAYATPSDGDVVQNLAGSKATNDVLLQYNSALSFLLGLAGYVNSGAIDELKLPVVAGKRYVGRLVVLMNNKYARLNLGFVGVGRAYQTSLHQTALGTGEYAPPYPADLNFLAEVDGFVRPILEKLGDYPSEVLVGSWFTLTEVSAP